MARGTGGKDSLVVWHMARAGGERPLSVYVSDGPLEFALNWRLPAIVQAMRVAEGRGDDAADVDAAVVVVKHVFVDDNFRRLSRSYLEPCGHPWAAVVLFDALLVRPLLLLVSSPCADAVDGCAGGVADGRVARVAGL